MFNDQLPKFESTVTSLDVWLEIAAVEGLDAEASELIKGYTKMISERIQNLYFTE